MPNKSNIPYLTISQFLTQTQAAISHNNVANFTECAEGLINRNQFSTSLYMQ